MWYNIGMGWKEDRYFYSIRVLRTIAEYYAQLYINGIELRNDNITNSIVLAEFKADFDVSLDAMGRGRWRGIKSSEFKDYHHFSRKQQIVISDILGLSDRELMSYGFYDIIKLRMTAYSKMKAYLNGVE